MKPEKKTYQAPVVVDYGSVAELTREAGAQNSDMPQGTPNTAYPAVS